MLETEIKKLNQQLETLNANFEKLFAQSLAAPSITVEPLPVKEEAVKEEAIKDVSESELKALCLDIARNKADKKEAMKFILSTYDAKKVSDIKAEYRAKVKAELEKL